MFVYKEMHFWFAIDNMILLFGLILLFVSCLFGMIQASYGRHFLVMVARFRLFYGLFMLFMGFYSFWV